MSEILQGLRQASARAIHGLGAGRTYNGDFMALFDAEATIPAGTTFNGAFLIWLNARMGTSIDNLVDAQNAFAVSLGLRSWGEVGTFAAAGGGLDALILEGGDDLLLESGDRILLE